MALTTIQNPHRGGKILFVIVSTIQESEPMVQWRLVRGKDNSAGCASQGLSLNMAHSHKLWWSGASWLIEDATKWSVSSYKPVKEAESEL